MIPKKIYLNYVNEEDENKTWSEAPVDVSDCEMLNREYTDLSQVWHEANEEPKEDVDILYISKNGKVHKVSKINQTLYDWLKDNDGIDKWAYISDLLPKGGMQ